MGADKNIAPRIFGNKGDKVRENFGKKKTY
jgi:hypothetical protein